MDYQLLIAIVLGIGTLLYLIIGLRLPAFLALLIASIVTALTSGMAPQIIPDAIKNGMGSTLGFIATIVGLGAMFGGILEHSGGALTLANYLVKKTGEKKAPFAMLVAGFLIAIPIFFDVGIIIMAPIINALYRKTGKSTIYFALPLLAGLAVSHAFIPPTPGPLAIAEILNVKLGYLILIGIVIGFPTAYITGIYYGKWLGDRLYKEATNLAQSSSEAYEAKINQVMPIMLLPLVLIVINSLLTTNAISTTNEYMDGVLILITHPFSALLIANLAAWYVLGRGNNFTTAQLTSITNKALYPAGLIILVTGAGGVFKQILTDTGAGKMIAESLQSWDLSIILFAFIAATFIRVIQGSATVAMITGAGLVAPVLGSYDLTDVQLACIAIAISSGATMASHVNDSGFWLIKEYLGLTEKEGLKTWTVASSIIGVIGFSLSCLLFYTL